MCAHDLLIFLKKFPNQFPLRLLSPILDSFHHQIIHYFRQQ